MITFVRDMEQLDFVGAVEYLAGKSGITLRYTDQDEGEGRKERAALREAMAEAVEWYHERLLTAPDAGPARRYLRDRGFDGDVVRAVPDRLGARRLGPPGPVGSARRRRRSSTPASGS